MHSNSSMGIAGDVVFENNFATGSGGEKGPGTCGTTLLDNRSDEERNLYLFAASRL